MSDTLASEATKDKAYWQEFRKPYLAWRLEELRALLGAEPPEELGFDMPEDIFRREGGALLAEAGVAQACKKTRSICISNWRLRRPVLASEVLVGNHYFVFVRPVINDCNIESDLQMFCAIARKTHYHDAL